MSPCSEKLTSYVHMTFSNQIGLHSIYASAHVAEFCLPPVSAGNNWWSACIFHGYRSNIPCRMRRIDSSVIPDLFSASWVLLLSVDVSAAKSSMTFCTTWTRSALKFGLPLCGWSSKLSVSSKRRTKLSIPFNGIGFFFYSSVSSLGEGWLVVGLKVDCLTRDLGLLVKCPPWGSF